MSLSHFLHHSVLVWDSQITGSNAHTVKSPVVDKERMRPEYWLGLVLCSL